MAEDESKPGNWTTLAQVPLQAWFKQADWTMAYRINGIGEIVTPDGSGNGGLTRLVAVEINVCRWTLAELGRLFFWTLDGVNWHPANMASDAARDELKKPDAVAAADAAPKAKGKK